MLLVDKKYDEANKLELKNFYIDPFDLKRESSVDDVIFYYLRVKKDLYSFYSKYWRKKETEKQDTIDVDDLEILSSFILDMYLEIVYFCKNDLMYLKCKDIYETMSSEGILEIKPPNVHLYTPSMIKLKAYSDQRLPYYTNGKLSDFEYILLSHYREIASSSEQSISDFQYEYQKYIQIYRNVFFEAKSLSTPGNNFFLDIENTIDLNLLDKQHIMLEAKLDAVNNNSINMKILESLKSIYNSKLQALSIETSKQLDNKTSREQEKLIEEAKLKELILENEYMDLCNLYIQKFNYFRKEYMLLIVETYNNNNDVVPYPLKKYYADIEILSEIFVTSSLIKKIKSCDKSKNPKENNECLRFIELQIKSYYQEQILFLFDNIKEQDEIENSELNIINEYKKKIYEFRTLCLQNINYETYNELIPLNRLVDYSFTISPDFHGLDMGHVIELGENAGRLNSFELHNIEYIRNKASEFISINCHNGDSAATVGVLGLHEVNLINEKFSTIEKRILSFYYILCEVYLERFQMYCNISNDIDDYQEFLLRAEDLINLPLTTYYDNKLDIATVERNAKIDKEKFTNPYNTAFFTKMKNVTQQRIFDINDSYELNIEEIKAEYIKTGDRKKLKSIYESLRLDIDRVSDEYIKLSTYYVKEFNEENENTNIEFNKGSHYYFQYGIKD